MLRRDASARLVKRKVGVFRRHIEYRFDSSTLLKGAVNRTAQRILKQSNFSQEKYDIIYQTQKETPTPLIEGGNRRKWWMFKNDFYWEDEGYITQELKALLTKRLLDKEKRLKRAKALLEQTENTKSLLREPIPDDVKIFVWRRDGGKCVKCGSKENLEFDHVIPLSKGDSSTARNIQLLCEKCNRSKGASLF